MNEEQRVMAVLADVRNDAVKLAEMLSKAGTTIARNVSAFEGMSIGAQALTGATSGGDTGNPTEAAAMRILLSTDTDQRSELLLTHLVRNSADTLRTMRQFMTACTYFIPVEEDPLVVVSCGNPNCDDPVSILRSERDNLNKRTAGQQLSEGYRCRPCERNREENHGSDCTKEQITKRVQKRAERARING